MSATGYYSTKKIMQIFGPSATREKLSRLEAQGAISLSQRFRQGAIYHRGWPKSDLPLIGEHLGFFKKFSRPVSLSVFTTKGGVLKSTLSLNIGRIAALHNLKTVVVGLDIQGDVTTALGTENDFENAESEQEIDQLIEKLNSVKGLADYFQGSGRLGELLVPTDLPTLFVLPETPELVALNDSLNNINRREFWLKEKVVDVLKEAFDLVIMDCSPNWNRLTTNALVASDLLVSPLECKINNFRNFKVFRRFLREFKEDMHLHFDTAFVPTRYSPNRKLSMEIRQWYQQNLKNATKGGVKESLLGEEATALHLSVLEHAPARQEAEEWRDLLQELHGRIETTLLDDTRPLWSKKNYTEMFLSNSPN